MKTPRHTGGIYTRHFTQQFIFSPYFTTLLLLSLAVLSITTTTYTSPPPPLLYVCWPSPFITPTLATPLPPPGLSLRIRSCEERSLIRTVMRKLISSHGLKIHYLLLTLDAVCLSCYLEMKMLRCWWKNVRGIKEQQKRGQGLGRNYDEKERQNRKTYLVFDEYYKEFECCENLTENLHQESLHQESEKQSTQGLLACMSNVEYSSTEITNPKVDYRYLIFLDMRTVRSNPPTWICTVENEEENR